jgi:putative spermidine/putrescine transport system ATP-binding protein
MIAARDVIAAFRGVRKTYDGETLVVRNLDLDIYRGEFLTLLGPSGSGKTTTLMMLAGFETPTAGAVTLEGRDLTRLPPHKRDIGMVFQNYALFPHMTVADNIAFPLSVRGIGRDETAQRIKRALGMVRLEGFEQRRPAQLSGGQQQRVALARALVFEPKLVLMDEPLGALDKQLREEMQLEIRHIHERLGVTVVYVTHDQAEALTMSDRIAVFHRGVVQQLDTPTALYERPGNAFVARFIGENNRLSGTVEQVSDKACTVRLVSGARIGARAVGTPAPGAPVIVSLRPERIALGGAPAGAAVNRVPATVQELIYLGDHIRARVELEGGESCMVKLPVAGRDGAVAEGARVEALWRAEDGLAMAPEE